MTAHTYALRKTWPDQADDYVVIDETGEEIGRTHLSAGTTPPAWNFSIGISSLPQQSVFRGKCPSLEAAKEEFKRLWPLYRAQWTDEDIQSARAHLRGLAERSRLWNAKHRPALK